jgi:hypothetical protein
VLRTAVAATSAVRCDLLERPVDDAVPVGSDVFALELRPFEVRTLRLTGF